MKKERDGFSGFICNVVLDVLTCGWWLGYRLLELPYNLIFGRKKK